MNIEMENICKMKRKQKKLLYKICFSFEVGKFIYAIFVCFLKQFHLFNGGEKCDILFVDSSTTQTQRFIFKIQNM